jgi:hypothetical protein
VILSTLGFAFARGIGGFTLWIKTICLSEYWSPSATAHQQILSNQNHKHDTELELHFMSKRSLYSVFGIGMDNLNIVTDNFKIERDNFSLVKDNFKIETDNLRIATDSFFR